MPLHPRHDPKKPGFLRNESGATLIEFVLVFPMLIWAFFGIYLFWDVYRGVNAAQKASYVVADALSRTSAPVSTNYLNGMTSLLAYLGNVNPARGEGARLRVTSVRWDIANNTHAVDWSYTQDSGWGALTNPMPAAIRDQIPTLTPFETVLLIETEVDYIPPFLGGDVGGDRLSYTIGIGAITVDEFIVIRPRFIPKVCLTGNPCT